MTVEKVLETYFPKIAEDEKKWFTDEELKTEFSGSSEENYLNHIEMLVREYYNFGELDDELIDAAVFDVMEAFDDLIDDECSVEELQATINNYIEDEDIYYNIRWR